MFFNPTAVSYKNVPKKDIREIMNIRMNEDKSIPTKWAIRHVPTGHFMPTALGYNGNGSSFWDHRLGQANEVRLFKSQRAAKIALSAWLLGQHIPEWDDGFCYVGEVRGVPERQRNEMEVVEIDLVPRVK